MAHPLMRWFFGDKKAGSSPFAEQSNTPRLGTLDYFATYNPLAHEMGMAWFNNRRPPPAVSDIVFPYVMSFKTRPPIEVAAEVAVIVDRYLAPLMPAYEMKGHRRIYMDSFRRTPEEAEAEFKALREDIVRFRTYGTAEYDREHYEDWRNLVKWAALHIMEQMPPLPEGIVIQSQQPFDYERFMRDMIPHTQYYTNRHRDAERYTWALLDKDYPEYPDNQWFRTLTTATLPYTIPDLSRFEGHWIVARTGTGKTNLLNFLIMRDLDRVARGECSVVVMEGKGDVVRHLKSLATFGKGGALEDRLIYWNVSEIEHPFAINLFSIGKQADRRLTISLIQYVLRSILGAEFTPRMNTMFTFAARLLVGQEGATLDDLEELFKPGGIRHFSDLLPNADLDTQSFFATQFDDEGLNKLTKLAIVDRIFHIKSYDFLSNMFKASKTKLDMFEQLGKGKVILIDTAQGELQTEGQEVFGRFVLKLILNASQRRTALEHNNRMDTYVYLDEAHHIIHRDESITDILDQARASRVGIVLAHQRLGQLSEPVFNALMGSAAIKMSARVSEPRDTIFARSMGTSTDFVANQPAFTFATHISGITRTAGSFSPPHTDIKKMPKMSEEDEREMIEDVRDRFAIKPTDKQSGGETTPPPPASPRKPPNENLKY